MNNYKKSSTKKDKDWDGYEPMTGTPMTGDLENGDTYNAGGITKTMGYTPGNEKTKNYAPDMRADADKRKEAYDIKSDVEQSFNNDPNLKNNIATPEFDYTKEEALGWVDSENSPNEKVAGADKNRSNRSYK